MTFGKVQTSFQQHPTTDLLRRTNNLNHLYKTNTPKNEWEPPAEQSAQDKISQKEKSEKVGLEEPPKFSPAPIKPNKNDIKSPTTITREAPSSSQTNDVKKAPSASKPKANITPKPKPKAKSKLEKERELDAEYLRYWNKVTEVLNIRDKQQAEENKKAAKKLANFWKNQVVEKKSRDEIPKTRQKDQGKIWQQQAEHAQIEEAASRKSKQEATRSYKLILQEQMQAHEQAEKRRKSQEKMNAGEYKMNKKEVDAMRQIQSTEEYKKFVQEEHAYRQGKMQKLINNIY